MSAIESGSSSGSTPLLPDEYDVLRERVRETVNDFVPRGATVLVVSRGDEELLRVGPRRAMHFPQDEFGRYAGYHPEDSEAAIAALEEMRTRGAEYLLLPNTSFWWLDYYEDLRAHLDRNYATLATTDECMIFELLTTEAQTAPMGADDNGVSTATQPRELAAPLDEVLHALLPADASIVIATGGGVELSSFQNVRAVRIADPGDGVGALLEAAGDAEFVVVPATAYDRLYGAGPPPDSVGAWRLVTRQRHMCEVWERVGRAARPRGFWQRIRAFFRRS